MQRLGEKIGIVLNLIVKINKQKKGPYLLFLGSTVSTFQLVFRFLYNERGSFQRGSLQIIILALYQKILSLKQARAINTILII